MIKRNKRKNRSLLLYIHFVINKSYQGFYWWKIILLMKYVNYHNLCVDYCNIVLVVVIMPFSVIMIFWYMAIYRKIDQESAWRSIKKRAFERFNVAIEVFFNSASENSIEAKIEASIYISVEAWQIFQLWIWCYVITFD